MKGFPVSSVCTNEEGGIIPCTTEGLSCNVFEIAALPIIPAFDLYLPFTLDITQEQLNPLVELCFIMILDTENGIKRMDAVRQAQPACFTRVNAYQQYLNICGIQSDLVGAGFGSNSNDGETVTIRDGQNLNQTGQFMLGIKLGDDLYALIDVAADLFEFQRPMAVIGTRAFIEATYSYLYREQLGDNKIRMKVLDAHRDLIPE